LDISIGEIISGSAAIIAVTASHFNLKGRIAGMTIHLDHVKGDLAEVKKKVINGHFVRREDCEHFKGRDD